MRKGFGSSFQAMKNRESAEAVSGPSGNRGLLAPFTGPTWTVIFLFTAGALSFYDAAVFDNSATAYARLNLPH